MPPERAERDRAVSPVIGVTLLVTMVVVLAAGVATVTLGFEEELASPSPQGGIATEIHPAGEDNGGKPYFTLTYEGGPTSDATRIVIKDESGNTVTWDQVWTTNGDVTAGDYIHIDGDGSDGALDHVCEEDQRFYILFEDDGGETLSVTQYEVAVQPDASNAPTAGWC